ncbi:MAG: ketoacyl-ACP synthase III family protein, partial [Clostridiales bacterium]|nr:ketoacyl-ACP synthase III family protein [Clostridiales bacterium]
MTHPVLKGAAYILVHTPDMTLQNGTTQTTERVVNPDSEYLKQIEGHMRLFDKAVSYPPNQAYIGSITPEELKGMEFPWYDKAVDGASRFGRLGEIMPQEEFYGLIKAVDSFDLVMLEAGFAGKAAAALKAHPLLGGLAEKVEKAASLGLALSEITAQVDEQHAEGLYQNGALVGCVKRAHDIDPNLNAHVMLENLVSKASGVLAFLNLSDKNGIDPGTVDYVIECSEEACGDMNQRGGGNFAKAIAELTGAVNATGSDVRGFCAAPTHALIQAASLVKAGTYKNVAVVAGGATAKLGMNGKDHVKKGLPILEDVVGGFAALIGRDDGVSPILNTDIVGTHTVGTGSAPQAVMTALVAKPLQNAGLKITDIDKFSVEMQNPDITKPAGAGDVPEANYKMIAALAVMKKDINREDIPAFVEKHGLTGWAPTQGHIPSGVPYLGFAREAMLKGKLNRVMIVGKGSLFLGRMTN